MMQYGIIDGVKDVCWECEKVTQDLAWYAPNGVFNQVCQDCIAKIFAEVGLDWGRTQARRILAVTVAEYIQALLALPPQWQVCVLEEEWGRFVEASEPTLCVAYVKGGMLYDCGPDGSEMRAVVWVK